jgi:hypothetical protein
MSNLSLPVPKDYVPPYDVTSCPELNSNIIDVGYKALSISHNYYSILANTKKEFNSDTPIDREKKLMELLLNEQKTVLKLTEINRDLGIKGRSVENIVAQGIIGEETVVKWIGELFNSAEITDQSHLSAKTDLKVKIFNRILLIEIKNKQTITKIDIDKFIRDMQENTNDVNGGIFISLMTPMIPNKGDFSLEYVADKPVIYLHSVDKNSLKIAIKTLCVLGSKENDNIGILINDIYSKANTISAYAASLEKNINESRASLENIRKETRNTLQLIDELFDNHPEYKNNISVQRLSFSDEEKKIIKDFAKSMDNKKVRAADFAQLLGVKPKYLQDRGGMSAIQDIIKFSESNNSVHLE